MWFAKGMDARITDGGAYGKGYERAMHLRALRRIGGTELELKRMANAIGL